MGAVNDSIHARLAGFEVPDGYGIVIGGEAEAIRENNRQLLVGDREPEAAGRAKREPRSEEETVLAPLG